MAAGEADQQADAAQDVAVRGLVGAGSLTPAVQLVSVQLQNLGDVVAVCQSTCTLWLNMSLLRVNRVATVDTDCV